jgi:hypothetical protein
VRVGDAGWRRNFEDWVPENYGRHQSCSPSEGGGRECGGNHESLGGNIVSTTDRIVCQASVENLAAFNV